MSDEIVKDWLNMGDFCEQVSKLMTEGQVRNIVLNREKTGASVFIRKIGKRLYLSPSKFYEWISRGDKEICQNWKGLS